jgi:tRNA-specific adenosine deaminase 2
VLVHKGEVIARGMNATNVTRNGTKHAEYMAIAALLSRRPDSAPANINEARTLGAAAVSKRDTNPEPTCDEEAYARQGHLYPYGQKLHRSPRVERSIIRDCVLYVTVEPCVMCAALLRQLGIKKVYFGAVNDKFGGTGGVFSIHLNSTPVPAGQEQPPLRESTNLPAPSRGARPGGFAVPRAEVAGGDGGSIEPGYDVEGGWGRDEAVSLLRRFYVQENGRGTLFSTQNMIQEPVLTAPLAAPVPRKKDGRAARLAAITDGTEVVETPEPSTPLDELKNSGFTPMENTTSMENPMQNITSGTVALSINQ